MRVVAISDLHGDLSQQIPPCDLLLIAGDVCPDVDQREWVDITLRGWLETVPAKHVVATFGNHDYLGLPGRPAVPTGLNWTLLIDREVTIEGLRIYGTPWTPRFYDWHYMLGPKALAEKWAEIPQDLDILIVHGPPYGICDTAHGGSPAGCDLLRRELEIKRPKLTVCGHIHESHGVRRTPYGIVANVALPYQDDLHVNEDWADLMAWHNEAVWPESAGIVETGR